MVSPHIGGGGWLTNRSLPVAFVLDQRMIFAFGLVVGDVIILGSDAEGDEQDVPAGVATALGVNGSL